MRGQLLAHSLVVGQLRQYPHIQFAGLATAGATVEASGVRVIAGAAAVPNQQHQRCRAGESHGRQCTGNKVCLARGVQGATGVFQCERPGGVAQQSIHRLLRRPGPKGAFQQPGRVGKARGLDRAEGARGATHEPLPLALAPERSGVFGPGIPHPDLGRQ